MQYTLEGLDLADKIELSIKTVDSQPLSKNPFRFEPERVLIAQTTKQSRPLSQQFLLNQLKLKRT
jgi:hypothetical protein